MIFIFLQLVAIVVSAEDILSEISESNIPEDGKLDFTGLATKYGLKGEPIEIVTEDLYVLTAFHIKGSGKPVILGHGLGDSSNTWLLRGSNSLAVALAKNGYDLWFFNVRGNRYSRKSLLYNPDTDERFWDFSFHEMGIYDWPATIDRVLNETKADKVDVIGHTISETALLVLMSLKPEYNNKVNLNIGLAAIAYLNHPGPLFSLLTKILPVILTFADLIGVGEVFGDYSAEKQLFELVCSQKPIGEVACNFALGLLDGYDPDGIEPGFFPTLIGQYPAGMSVKTLKHFDQVVLSHRFAPYASGLTNLNPLNSRKPKEYDLSKVTCKMAFLYGENDPVSPPVNVLEWSKLLPNVVSVQAIKKKEWTHIDFMWSREADKYLFGTIINLLETKYE